MPSIPTLKELIKRKKNTVIKDSVVKNLVSKELKRMLTEGDSIGNIYLEDKVSANEALDILWEKGYYNCVNLFSEWCKHDGCEDCGYESDRDNQNCVHFTNEYNYLVSWEVRISLPASKSDSDSD